MECDNRYKDILKRSYDKIKELEQKVTELEKSEPIAIIGLACNFPGGANSPEKYWELLRDKVETLQVIPKDRWNIDEYYDPTGEKPDGIITKYANFIEDIDKFDSNFFGVTPKEAEAIDPQHRLLLETSWNALENAGLNIDGLRGSNTGVFVGITGSEYLRHILDMPDKSKKNNPYFTTGLMSYAACGRLSYFYDFKGPSVAVDTACSSSLVSVDMAVKNLRNNQCDLAIAGGVSAIVVPDSFTMLTKLKGISADGRCKSFDASADGFGRGEGCGFIVLKRLKDAVASNDNILAVIRGSAIGHDGKSNGFAAPNGLAQEKVIKSALEESGLTTDDIDFIEAHGTGTPLGDPIEVQAINSVYKNKKEKVLIGTVKTNFGHLEAAAGIAGIIKVVLAMQNEKIPPNLHYNNPNTSIPWEQVNLKVVTELTPWKNNKLKSAGVSSFGIAGTVGHVIVQEYSKPEVKTQGNLKQPYGILTISTKSKSAMSKMLEQYKNYIENTSESVLDICYTSNISRSFLPNKVAFVGKDKKDFVTKIIKYLERNIENTNSKIINNKVVFLFTGQGSHYKNICKELFDSQPYFREIFSMCDREFQKHLDESIIDILYNNDDEEIIFKTKYAQPIIFSIEYALAKLWMSWGVRPSLVMGHSIGEYVAGCIAGIFTLSDAVYMVAKRGQILSEVDGQGKMLSILANIDTVNDLIDEYKDYVSIAAVNGLNNITVSGRTNEIEAILNKAKKKRIFVEKLKISVPFHSVLLAPYVPRYKDMIQHIQFSQPQIPILSIKNGKQADMSNVNFWSSHIEESISFYEAIKVIEYKKYQVFLEIGGNATLSGLATECYDNAALFVPSLRKDTDCWLQLLSSAKELYCEGVNINWNEFHKYDNCQKINTLPLYQFQKKRYWIEDMSDVQQSAGINLGLEAITTTINNEDNQAIVVKSEELSSSKRDKQKDYECVLSELKETLYTYTGIEAEDIDIDRELFELGLDSLMITQLRRKIKEVYGLDIDLNTFFVELKTLAKIAEWVYDNQKDTLENINIDKDSQKEIKTVKVDEVAVSQNFEQKHEQVSNSMNLLSAPSEMKQIISEQIELMKKQLDTLQAFYNKEESLKVNSIYNKDDNLLKEEVVTALQRKQTIEKMIYSIYWEEDKSYAKELEKRLYDVKDKTFLFFADANDIAKHLIEYCENQGAHCVVVQKGEEYKQIDNYTYEINTNCKEDYEKLFNNIEKPQFIIYLWGIDGINGLPDNVEEISQIFEAKYTSLLHLMKTVIKLKMQDKIKLWLITQNVHVPNNDYTVTNSLTQSTLWGFGRVISMEQSKAWGGIIDIDDEVYKTYPEYVIKFILSEKEEEVSIRNNRSFYFTRFDRVEDKINAIDKQKQIKRNASYLITGGLGELGLLTADLLVERGASNIILVSRNKPKKEVQERLENLRKNANIVVMHGDVSNRMDMQRIMKNISELYPSLKGIFHCAGTIDDSMLMTMNWEKINKVFEAKVYGAINLHQLTCSIELDFFVMFSSIASIGSIGQSNYAAANNFLNALAEYRKKEGLPAVSINWGPWDQIGMQNKYPAGYLESEGIYGINPKIGIEILERLFLNDITQPAVIEVDWNLYKNFLPERRKEGLFLYSMHENLVSNMLETYTQPEYEIYPMSSVQKRLFALSQIEERELSYHITNVINIEGNLDIDKLEAVLNTLIERHEALRTGFHAKNKKFIQTIYKDVKVKINIINSTTKNLEQVISDNIDSFDLTIPPLMHANLIKLDDKKFTLVLDYHHIIIDGFSMDIMIEEFIKLYNNLPLAKIDKSYRDYTLWEKKFLLSEDYKRQEKYWEDQILSDYPLLNLPTDYPRRSIQSFEGKTLYFKIDKEKTDLLKDIAKDTNTSLYMIMFAALNMLLHYITRQNDIVIGSPVAIRNYEFENVIGMFTNTVVFRNKIDEEASFREFLKSLKENCLQVYANQEYPFENIVNKATSKRDLSHNPIFDVMFAFENIKNREFSFGDLFLKRQNYEHEQAMFDLLFAIQNEPEFLNIGINFCTNLFNATTIERWYSYYENILDLIIKNQDILIKNIDFLPEDERNTLVVANNLTYSGYSKDKLLHQLFEEQVDRTPNNIAATFTDRSISYSELNAKANQLAYEIREISCDKEKIAIIIDRSIEMIIGALGILKSGASYVPMEPDIPAERIKYILELLNIKTIITDYKNVVKLASVYNNIKSLANIIILDQNFTGVDDSSLELKDKNLISYESLVKKQVSNLSIISSAEDDAYVIFTSGTTGKPKGVIVKHRPVINLIEWVNSTYNVNGQDKILFITSLSFDLSVYDIFGTLASGGQIRIAAKEEIKDPKRLLEIIINENITFWDSAPPALQLLIPFLPSNKIENSHLRLAFLSGDWIPVSLPDKMRRVFDNLRIISLGGATEAVIWSNYYEINDVPLWWTSIPYGKPIQNAKYYILDEKLRICPIGVVGDLYIGGECLAAGYTDAELTKTKFIPSPFDKESIIYDTGDMARWYEDGNIELLGRKDSQVKIRGYRIELGEIEAVLKENEAILDLVVIAKEVTNNEKKIIAYYILNPEYAKKCGLDIEFELKGYLKGRLPEYMIPSYFVLIDKVPVTANGKLDRKALPEPEQETTNTNYIAPRNETEKKLVNIWEEVLGRKNIGILDDFFELGGNSMNLISLASKMYEDMVIEIPMMELFSNPTIKGIASYYTDNVLALEAQKAMVLLNKEKDKKIFFFPDLIGVGAIYKKFASLFKDYAFYVFNYIEEEDRIDQYVDMILNTDDSGEYLLMAYSAGGSIAFEVAKKLEEKNKKVSSIIMIDTYKNKNIMQISDEQKEEFIKQVEYNINRHYVVGKVKDEIISRSVKYYEDYMKTDNCGIVGADIHLITSEDRSSIFSSSNDNWDNSTSGLCKKYQGVGPHLEMLQYEYAKKNIELIFSILNLKEAE